MNVKIISDLSGEMQFDMSAENLVQLIGSATRYAADNPATVVFEAAKDAVQEYAKQPEQKLEKPVSKVERMFGDYKSRIPIPSVLPKMPAVSAPKVSVNDCYKGFMYIECEGCGSVRGYFAKNPQSYYHCACGHTTKLESIKTMYPKCSKCGATFKYMTNCSDEGLTYNCIDCSAPIDMELNSRGTTYVTVR